MPSAARAATTRVIILTTPPILLLTGCFASPPPQIPEEYTTIFTDYVNQVCGQGIEGAEHVTTGLGQQTKIGSGYVIACNDIPDKPNYASIAPYAGRFQSVARNAGALSTAPNAITADAGEAGVTMNIIVNGTEFMVRAGFTPSHGWRPTFTFVAPYDVVENL